MFNVPRAVRSSSQPLAACRDLRDIVAKVFKKVIDFITKSVEGELELDVVDDILVKIKCWVARVSAVEYQKET